MFNRNKRRGASLGEYGLVVGLISVLAVAAVAGVGRQVSHTFGDATATLSDRMAPPSTGGAATDRPPAFETAGDLGSFAFDQPFSAVVAAIDPEGDAISYDWSPDRPGCRSAPHPAPCRNPRPGPT